MSLPTPDQDDATLLAAFLGGEEISVRDHAFAILVRRHGPMVAATCRRWLSGADLEDAVQAVFLVLAQRASTIRVGGALPGWLHQTAWNVAQRAASAAKARRIHEQRAAKEAAAMPCSSGPPSTSDVDLDKVLVRLPEDYRTPLVMHYFEGLTQAEVARHLGVKENTIAMRLSRGRSMLRAHLERVGAPAAALGVFLVAAGPLSASEEAGLRRMPELLRTGNPPEAARQLAAAVTASPLAVLPIAALLAAAVLVAGLFVWQWSPSMSAVAPAPAAHEQEKPVPRGWSVVLGWNGSRPRIAPDGRILCADGQQVRAFSADGEALWTAPVPGLNGSMVLSGGDLVLVPVGGGTGTALVALAVDTGGERWRREFPTGSRAPSIAALPDGHAMVLAPGAQGRADLVVRLDHAGAVSWTREWPAVASHGRTWTLVCDRMGRVVACDSDGVIRCMAPDGVEAWKASVDARVTRLVPLADGGVAVAGMLGDESGGDLTAGVIGGQAGAMGLLAVFDPNGTCRWRHRLAGVPGDVQEIAGVGIVCGTSMPVSSTGVWLRPRQADDTVVGGRCVMLGAAGDLRWDLPMRAPVGMEAMLLDRAGCLVIARLDGWLVQLSLDGHLLGEREVGGYLEGLSEASDGRLVMVNGAYGPSLPGREMPSRLVVLPADWHSGGGPASGRDF